MTEYFSKLFTASHTDWSALLGCIDSKVTEQQNDMMLAPVEEKEVKEALFHKHLDKGSGPEGMTPGF